MNTSGRLQSQREALRAALTLLENRSIHDSMNLPKMNSILKCYRVKEVLLPNFEFLGSPLTVLINKNKESINSKQGKRTPLVSKQKNDQNIRNRFL